MTRAQQWLRQLPFRIAIALLIGALAYLYRFGWPSSWGQVERDLGFRSTAEEPAPGGGGLQFDNSETVRALSKLPPEPAPARAK